MGGAWLTGGVQALAEELGWDPESADCIVGTSAGSMVGALVASGLPPWFMVAHSAGETFEGLYGADGTEAAVADRSAGAVFRPAGVPIPVPGSLRMMLAAAARPTSSHAPSAWLAGLIPAGVVSGDPLRDIIRRVAPQGWTGHPDFWAVACDYANGRRVAFGRHDAPEAELADAVAASCAIPGFYEPVRIAGRRYVDGGLWSTSNLDLLCEEELDLVICLNPTSSLHPPRAWNPIARVGDVVRSLSGRRLGSEAKVLRATGTHVVLIQPLREDLDAMGPNLMARRGRNKVIRVARETVARQLDEAPNRAMLTGLPPGPDYKLRRPSAPVSEWPRLAEEARAQRGEGGRDRRWTFRRPA